MLVSGGLWLSRWRAVSMLFLVRGTYEYVDGRGSRWRGYREASSNVYGHIPAKVVASRSQKPGCQAAAGICEHISTCRLILAFIRT